VTVRRSVALQSKTIEALLDGTEDEEDEEDDNATTPVLPLPPVTPEIMHLALEYMNYHEDNADTPEAIQNEWDRVYIEALADEPLFALISAANFLETKGLLDLCCQCVADKIQACDTPQAIRRRFNIVNDFTPEEEAAVVAEIEWVES
jgi:S-phase kinase-associated protein 1